MNEKKIRNLIDYIILCKVNLVSLLILKERESQENTA